MKAWFLWGAGLLLLTAAACADSSESTTADPDPLNPSSGTVGETGGGEQTAKTIRFAVSLDAAEAGEFVNKFDLLEVSGILVVVPVVVESGIEFLKFDLSLPDGNPYREIWRAYTTDPDPPSTVPHPVLGGEIPVVPVVDVEGEPSIYLAIPVAGTNITEYKITGIYPCEARIGVEDVPAHATGSFEIYFDAGAMMGGGL